LELHRPGIRGGEAKRALVIDAARLLWESTDGEPAVARRAAQKIRENLVTLVAIIPLR
jgi:hypothetical protein